MIKILNTLVQKTLLLILLWVPFIGSSQSILSKYQIDNVNKSVTVPFTDVYIWSNYFIRYEYLNNSNIELNQYLTKTFQIDSANKINHSLIYTNFINIQKQDSIQKVVLETKISQRDTKIDTLKETLNKAINKNFVTENVTVPLEKQKSFDIGKTKGMLKGGIYGTAVGVVITILLKIALKF